MQLQDILYSQGFGTRRVCAGLVQQGHVRVDGAVVNDAATTFDPHGLRFEVDGVVWPYHEKAYVMLHKPAGTECSAKPSAYPSVYTLLPAPLRQRPVPGGTPGVQAIGRLDQDTTGLLLLSDDGQFIHRMASPRHHVPKVYELRTNDAVTGRQIDALFAGVQLHGERELVRASACELTGERSLRLTITQGKYHQVKRMVAAVGNAVASLHRSRIGSLELPPDLALGEWRWLSAEDLAALRA